MADLGVNIDHVATLRQARMGNEPEPNFATTIAEQNGADQITVHLREDRRHIQEKDVRILRDIICTRLNLEMAVTEKMVKFARNVKPDTVTFVPEKRQELTTEGGLILQENFAETIELFKEIDIEVSVFIEPRLSTIEMAKKIGADAVEIHTGKYANLKDRRAIQEEINKIEEAAILIKRLGMRVVAGHGLNYYNVKKLVNLNKIEEFNIGHSIISRAVFVGLADAVKTMKDLIT